MITTALQRYKNKLKRIRVYEKAEHKRKGYWWNQPLLASEKRKARRKK